MKPPPLADSLPDVPEPGIYFFHPDAARDALADWASRRLTLDDERDALVRGALAAGVTPTEVHTTTNLARRTAIHRSTVAAIVPDRSAIAVACGKEDTDYLRYASLLRHRALRLQREADEAGVEDDGYLFAYCDTTSAQARRIYRDCVNDAAAQTLAAQARRAAEAPRQEPAGSRPGRFEQGARDAFARTARELNLLRAEGTDVLDGLFEPTELDAELAALRAHSDAMTAWAQGPRGVPAPVDPDPVAAYLIQSLGGHDGFMD